MKSFLVKFANLKGNGRKIQKILFPGYLFYFPGYLFDCVDGKR